MQRTQSKAIHRAQSVNGFAKVLFSIQVITMILMVLSGIGNVGLAKAIINHLPVVVSTMLIAASVRSMSIGNEARAHSILSYGVLLVGVSVLLAARSV